MRTVLGTLLAGALLAAAVVGCRPAYDGPELDPAARAARRSARQPGAAEPPDRGTFNFRSSGGNEFTVDDAQGRPLLRAKMSRTQGSIRPGGSVQGPVLMQDAKCLLYQKGVPQIDLQSPEATWDGQHLRTQREAHGVTADGKTVIDARKAVWTAETAHLALVDAKLQAIKAGKTDFTAAGPEATVVNRLVTMRAGCDARNAEGQELTARTMRWHLDTGRLDAEGSVVVRDAGRVLTGDRLRADTRLERGRLTGHSTLHLDPGAARSARKSPAGRPATPGGEKRL